MARIRLVRPLRLLPLLIAAAACDLEVTPPPEPTQTLSPAHVYLDRLVTLMQHNSVNRAKIDWTDFRTRVFAATPGAQTIPETYPAIRVALGLLGDGHSHYRAPNGTFIFVPTRTCSAPTVGGTPPLPANVGYVRVRSFSGSAQQATDFAHAIQDSIRAHDREGLAGWIVDLRNNGGGNMWPMIAGVGPVLGEGLAGYFVYPAGNEAAWRYEGGAAWLEDTQIHGVTTVYRLRRERPRVAVLTDNRVASSGEATAIAFRQRSDTRSFGTATCGLSTSNFGYVLSDGAVLNLTTAVMADRTKQPYGDQVVPDEVITDPEQQVRRAIEWLQTGR